MTKEEKIKALTDFVLSRLEMLAGMAAAFDEGMGNALLNVAILLQGGQRDKIVEMLTTEEIQIEAMGIIMRAQADVGLELGPPIMQ